MREATFTLPCFNCQKDYTQTEAELLQDEDGLCPECKDAE